MERCENLKGEDLSVLAVQDVREFPLHVNLHTCKTHVHLNLHVHERMVKNT